MQHAALVLFLAGVAIGAPLGYKPHLVFMMADDLGHYNVGFKGNREARTPTLDSLAKEGVVLDRHYTYQYCSPTRSSLLSGRLPIHVNEQNVQIWEDGGVDLRMQTVADKLAAGGYTCHQVGKWHAGGKSWGNLPAMRGFNTSFGYLSGEEDHYTQDVKGLFVDIWDTMGPAYGKNGQACPPDNKYCESAFYNGYQYTARATDIIAKHDPSTPLFLYIAWQEAHTPNEVPERFQDPSIDFELRRVYQGMVGFLDSAVGNVTAALKERGMWERTLLVFSSDNGGREDKEFGGNNYPLRGMKFTDFEGGVRVAAFASGGVPLSKKGGVEEGLIHITDWYATFCHLAGVDPRDDAPNVPGIDSISMVPTLFNSTKSPRTEIALSSNSYIMWPYKLVTGTQGGKGWWTGAIHPNGTKVEDSDPGCPQGCLFNILSDPAEHIDLSAQFPDVKHNLTTLLSKAKATAYQTHDTPGYTKCVDIKDFAAAHKGFGGPVCSKG